MNKALVAVLVVVGAGAAVWGGLAIKHSMTCRGLEEDYLNAASDLRGSVAIRAVGGSELSDAADRIQEMTLQKMELTLEQLYSECGARAGATASRKASEELLGF